MDDSLPGYICVWHKCHMQGRDEQRRQRLRDERITQPLEGCVEASLDESTGGG